MRQSRLSGAVALMLSQALVLILGFIAHFWIARVLGQAAYGTFGIVLSIQTMLGLFLTLGVPMAVSRFVARDNSHAFSILKQALRIQFLMAIAFAILAVTVSPLIAHVLGDDSLTPLVSFVAIILLLQSIYPVFIQYFSGLHQFYRQAALTSLYALAKLLGAISLIYLLGVYGAFTGFAIGGLVAAAVGWLWSRHTGGTAWQKLPTRHFLTFAGTYVLILFSLQLLISLDLFMVKALLRDNNLTGYYNAAVTLSRISYLLLQSLTFILLPSVSALTKPGVDHQPAISFIRESLRYLIGLIVPSIALAAATSGSLIRLFYSADYLPAERPLTILMIGLGFISFYLLLANIVAGAGHARVALNVTLLLLAISVIFGFILIPSYGLIGAAWQTSLTGAIGFLILSIYTFRVFAIPFPAASTLNFIIASAAITFIALSWTASPLLLPLQYLALLTIYLLLLYLLGEIKPADLTLLASLHPALARFKPKSSSSV